jgi:pentatricopeptide repeat protein
MLVLIFKNRTRDNARINRMLHEAVSDGFIKSRNGPWENMVISQFFDSGNIRAGLEMAGKVSNNEGKRDKMMAEVLDMYCRASVQGAEMSIKVVEEMKRMDLQPGAPVYRTIVMGFAKLEEMVKCREAMQRMRRERAYPDVETYNHVITAAGNTGDLYLSLLLLDEMQGEGVKPDIQTFNRLIHVFAKKGSIEDCFKLLEKMQQFGMTPDQHTFNSFWTVVWKPYNTEELKHTMDMLIERAGGQEEKLGKGEAQQEVQKLGEAMKNARLIPGMNAFYWLMLALKQKAEVFFLFFFFFFVAGKINLLLYAGGLVH